jgi:hypothetical protein
MQTIENLRNETANGGMMIHHQHIVRVAHASIRRPGLALCGLFVIGLLQAAFAADDPSMLTTVGDTTVTNTVSDDGNGNTTSSTHTTTSTQTTTKPGDAANRSDAWKNDPNAKQFPYDSTGGANRSDVDTARKGFDDPRNPWDGRYSNDNPANHPAGSAYDRGEPQHDYRPGDFGTHSVGNGRGRGRRN